MSTAQRETVQTPTTSSSATSTTSAAGDRHWTGAPDDSPWLEAARDMVPVLAEDADRMDRSGEFPVDSFRVLQERKFMSMLVPSELGGGGASHAEACAVLAELAR
ncbi:hypothetical protein BH10ACT3_BH10ACT3_15140 [soil metagenome]